VVVSFSYIFFCIHRASMTNLRSTALVTLLLLVQSNEVLREREFETELVGDHNSRKTGWSLHRGSGFSCFFFFFFKRSFFLVDTVPRQRRSVDNLVSMYDL